MPSSCQGLHSLCPNVTIEKSPICRVQIHRVTMNPTFGLLLDPNQTEATKPRVLTMQSSQYSGDHIQMQLEHVKRTYTGPVASGCTFRRTATKAQYSNRAQRGHKIAFLTQLDQAKTLPNPFPPHAQVWPRQIFEVTNSEAV